jgi:hypothetical protein
MHSNARFYFKGGYIMQTDWNAEPDIVADLMAGAGISEADQAIVRPHFEELDADRLLEHLFIISENLAILDDGFDVFATALLGQIEKAVFKDSPSITIHKTTNVGPTWPNKGER